VTEASSATLAPLEGTTASTPDVTAPPSLAPVPHLAWYYVHRAAVDDELRAMRTLSSTLATTDAPDWRALICTTGIDLDQASYRIAYEAPDVHPDWVAAVDLTRWMIAGCATDAEGSIGGTLPKLQAALGRFERWMDRLVEG
jgi:hypothetical protein